jgi:hypothetical protein
VNPAVELLLAYLKRAQERNAELKTVADNLRSELNYARKSRDAWKSKAKARRLALKSMTASRDLWRHRALIRQEDSHAHSGRTTRRIAA